MLAMMALQECLNEPPSLFLATVERVGSSDAPSPFRLLVGSLHDNALLLCRALVRMRCWHPQLHLPCAVPQRNYVAPVRSGDHPAQLLAQALDSFPSPLVLRTRTRSAVKGRGTSIQVGLLQEEP